MSEPGQPLTLAVDCGGTGLKACVVDAGGTIVSERVRMRTPYPLPPDRFLATLTELVADLPRAERASVGVPGLVRRGIVHATPHYVTEAGPFTERVPELVAAWKDYDVQTALAERLGVPVRVVNDAEMQGLAVVSGHGYEVMLTLGTGVGFAHFDEGCLLPKVELSQHPLKKSQTYDERLGNHVRLNRGNERWAGRVLRAVRTLERVLWWDRLYVGGGNAKHLGSDVVAELGSRVEVVPNTAGLVGGARLWEPTSLRR